jgi:hypothetical protein
MDTSDTMTLICCPTLVLLFFSVFCIPAPLRAFALNESLLEFQGAWIG